MEEELQHFYHKNLVQFGPSAQGVGWKNKEAQAIRFEQLVKVFRKEAQEISVNDLGCGVGDLVSYLEENVPGYIYRGYDVMAEMISLAKEKYKEHEKISFYTISSASDMQKADYTIASGIFNIRFDTNDESWLRYILETLQTMNEKSRKGFAFNILTKYSDKEFMKPELYYADPSFLFDYCKQKFAKNVALLHDYNQYDFTIIVRKEL